ncbi:MAG: AAA family ATPase [Planctomycetota bacterium]
MTEQLRWNCDETTLGFATTREVEPLAVFIGQSDAVESLLFGLDHMAPGQNVFVRGASGTGRLTLVRRLLAEIEPNCSVSPDLVYVRNFAHPSRPRLLTFESGEGRRFVRVMDDWAEFASKGLDDALGGEVFRHRSEAISRSFEKRMEAVRQPFEAQLAKNDLTLTSIPAGDAVRTLLVPIVDGNPAPPERLRELQAEGRLSEGEMQAISKTIERFNREFQEIGAQLQRLQQERQEELRQLVHDEIRCLLHAAAQPIRSRFQSEEVSTFLDECVEDIAQRGAPPPHVSERFSRRYRANLLHTCSEQNAPVVVETMPTQQSLVGCIERKLIEGNEVVFDHLMITEGAILRANGGYLVLDARDLLSERGAWHALVRTLRSGVLEIMPSQPVLGSQSIQPEPIPVSVKVVLIGTHDVYYLLDHDDPDFRNLFKVLADFDDELPLSQHSIADYARYLARLSHDDRSLPFAASGVAALAEHGARIAGRNDRLTARFGRLTDIAREAAYLAKREGDDSVTRELVQRTIVRMRRRADLPARRFRERIVDGTVTVAVSGREIGQINGLAVLTAGSLTFAFPSRITATIGAGSAGMINIERESQLSGSIHTKGFYILGGLLRRLLPTAHPLAFSASIAFEQSYGGIDGDSASAAEMCCLLSALTDIPLRQDLAMTGAIDQLGNVQTVGAVSEKVEGFFDTCSDIGLTGTQGCIVPRANVRNLMLRHDVVEACSDGRFHVYAVARIEEALELFTSVEPGKLDEETGLYPEDTILGIALDRAYAFWSLASANPNSSAFEGAEERELLDSDEPQR